MGLWWWILIGLLFLVAVATASIPKALIGLGMLGIYLVFAFIRRRNNNKKKPVAVTVAAQSWDEFVHYLMIHRCTSVIARPSLFWGDDPHGEIRFEARTITDNLIIFQEIIPKEKTLERREPTAVLYLTADDMLRQAKQRIPALGIEILVDGKRLGEQKLSELRGETKPVLD